MTEFVGTLRERITIEKPIATRTATGVKETGWEPMFSCFAAVALEGAGAESEGQALSAMPKVRVTIRRRAGPAIDHRIRWGQRLLMIRQLLDDPRAKDRLVLRCEEVRA
jgi:head-tail adaptor